MFLIRIDPATPLAFVTAVTNPEATSGARPAESAESVRANAPEAFLLITHRGSNPTTMPKPWNACRGYRMQAHRCVGRQSGAPSLSAPTRWGQLT